MGIRKAFTGLSMMAAAAAGLVSPVPQAQVAQDGVQVQQPARAAPGSKTVAATPRSTNANQSARLIGAGGLVARFQPFAPWRAPLYNQRKARRDARRQGRRVRRS